jgi:hypothetical protein
MSLKVVLSAIVAVIIARLMFGLLTQADFGSVAAGVLSIAFGVLCALGAIKLIEIFQSFSDAGRR